jgi:hypothetical protein
VSLAPWQELELQFIPLEFNYRHATLYLERRRLDSRRWSPLLNCNHSASLNLPPALNRTRRLSLKSTSGQ